MRFSLISILIVLLSIARPIAASPGVSLTVTEHLVLIGDAEFSTDRPRPWLKKLLSKNNMILADDSLRHMRRKKIFAAVLAFPLPFGIVGLHRIYMGTAPYVPVVYIGTLGAFGVLPLIDFICILAEKDLNRFVGKEKVFMWVD